MATINPFDLLGDDDTGDLALLIAAQKKIEPKKAIAPAAKASATQNKAVAQPKLPGKPIPPAQAVREAKSDSARGGRGSGRGYARGRGAGGGFNRDSPNNENSYGNREISAGQGAPEEAGAGNPSEKRSGFGSPRGPYRGGRRGGFSNGESGEGEFDRERQRRPYERHSGTGRGKDLKREGGGRGNWGTQADEFAQVTEEIVNEAEKSLDIEKPSGEQDAAADGDKEAATNQVVEEKPEDKEMTLEEYEKVLEEKRKALQALKTTEERKVDVKEFESMQQLSNKKANDEIFIKLGSEKDKKKELAEKEERAKKSVSINEFLKPAEGERWGRGRGGGRGRDGRGGGGGYGGGREHNNVKTAPEIAIEDQGQFPTLGGKGGGK